MGGTTGKGTGSDRARVAASVLLCATAAALVGFTALRSGGYHARDFLPVGIVAFVAAGGALVWLAAGWTPSRSTLCVLVSLMALAGWTGLSAAWSPDPAAADVAMQRGLTYAAAYLLFALAVRSGRHAALLLKLVVGVLVGVCVVAMLSRLRPQLIGTDASLAAFAQGRLAHPLGYWNALGAVAAMAVVGCLALASEAREHIALRCAAAAGGAQAICTLYLTISRASGLALALALAVVLSLSPRRLRLTASGLVVAAAGAVGVAVLRAHPVLVDEPGTLSAQADAGGRVLVALIGVLLGAAAVQLALSRVGALNHERPRTAFRRQATSATRVAAYALPALLVALVLAGVYTSSSDSLEGQAADGTLDLRSFVDRQYAVFMDTAKPAPVGQDRLTTARSSRSDAYRVALDGFRAGPLRGDGAGGYRLRWMRERKVPESFRNAHSLELETASELGLVGLLLLGGVLIPLGGGLRRLRRAGGGLTRAQAAAAGGILTVWLGHSALDWDWQMAAVTLPALACGAILLAQAPGGAQGSSRRSAKRSGPW